MQLNQLTQVVEKLKWMTVCKMPFRYSASGGSLSWIHTRNHCLIFKMLTNIRTVSICNYQQNTVEKHFMLQWHICHSYNVKWNALHSFQIHYTAVSGRAKYLFPECYNIRTTNVCDGIKTKGKKNRGERKIEQNKNEKWKTYK